MNKHFLKGKKAKELLNVGVERNPYHPSTREYYLWNLGNKSGVYTNDINCDFEEERNAEIILGDDIH